MLFEKIKSPGLAHLSYLIGSGSEAAVIDPRRDCAIYLDKARAEGMEITRIFETHRNEDLVSGAPILAEMSGAKVFHGPNADGVVRYAKTTREGDCFEIGSLRIEVLETPGHTDDHLAYAVYDSEFPEKAVGVFTGDCLFVGDVGRTDFYPDRAEEVAGLMFDSLRKLEKLGDQALIWPAHGAGSVCGSGMADREISTIGHERANNPRMQIRDRAEFIEAKLAETHYQPPYLRLMERLNLEGGSPPPPVLRPVNLTLKQLNGAGHRIDIREPAAWAAAHLPGSWCLPVSMIPAFAGWFVGENDAVELVAASEDQAKQALTHFTRIGLDNITGAYVGVVAATAKGKDFRSMEMVDSGTVEQRLEEGANDWVLLDVRAEDEVEEARIDGSRHIYAGHLNEQWQELDPDCRYTVMCGSGMRATVAASWLETKGFDKVDVYLGSMGAWKAAH
jgi:hydroxyacylglutathione hydrolase